MLNLFWKNSNLYQPKFSNIALNMFESIESILRNLIPSVQSVQLLCCVQLFATPWTAARQASLSITNSWSLLKIMSIASVMPSNHLILCRPLLFLPSILPSIRVSYNESGLCIRWPKTGASASASVLPMNIQGWFALEWTSLISLQSKGLSRVFNTIVQKYQFFGTQVSLWSNSHIHTCYWKSHSFDYMDLCWKNNVSAF